MKLWEILYHNLEQKYQNDDGFELWRKAQEIILAGRTKKESDTILVGDKKK